jgi:hypothetical protein
MKKPGNAKAGFGPGAKAMGGLGVKNNQKAKPAPSDNDGDEAPAFKRGGPVKKKMPAKKGKC